MGDERGVVIGAEMAAAMAADARRLARDPGPSPLPPGRYDPRSGELSLLDPSPVALDDALRAYARAYRDLPADERKATRDATGTDDAYIMLAFARRSAIFAMRTRDATHLIDGLTACAAIGGERIDGRDALLALSLLHHAARRVGADPAALLMAAAALGDEELKSLIDGFLARSEAERDLRDAWGHVEVEASGGVGLLRWGFARWLPTGDLIGASLRLADALRGDDYIVDDPELAVKVPSIWLSQSGDHALESILVGARAAAVIHGRLRPEATPTHAAQQLTTWLVELGDAAAADHLVQLSGTPRPGDALLGIAVGPLFALVVARSAVVGIDPHEDSASLDRFARPIKRALEHRD